MGVRDGLVRVLAVVGALALLLTVAPRAAEADDPAPGPAAADGVAEGLEPPEAAASTTAAPVATDELTYEAYGRVFPDPHGCYVHGDELPPDGTPISPWAKGTVCALDYLGYTDVIAGAEFLAQRYPDLVEVIRLDERYGDPSMRSAGIARPITFEDGDVKILGRDKSPLYMFKVTDDDSPVPEEDREHFVFSMAIHGLERAGLEGGIRAMEDLVTWAACEDDPGAAPACGTEGEFPKPIVEGDTDRPVPTAGQTLENSVLYFVAPNPDGWRHGEKRAAEFRDGDPNANFHFGPSHARHGGHGVDLNRDWPTVGYTDQSHQPWSEPETRAFGSALSDIRDETSAGRFAGGIDLHGMLTASAFSYTLLGADQRDYRKNAITVETSLRTWEDQSQRLTWSPYIGDSTGDGEQDRPAPLPVADEWGTIFDTLAYTITGGFGPWMDDSRIGLGGVGINNEMALSHAAPNNVYEPSLVQTHIDGNKGLIYSQISALLHEAEAEFTPPGRIAYVAHDQRLEHDRQDRPANTEGLPPQSDIEVLVPCQDVAQPQLPGSCAEGTMAADGTQLTYEFDVRGPDDGVFNGGLSVTSTAATGFVGHQVAVHAGVRLDRLEEGEWVAQKELQRTHTTYNDPRPGRWRIRFEAAPSVPRRVEIAFHAEGAEADPGQLGYSVSNLDFYDELNDYVPDGRELEAVSPEAVAAGDGLDGYDTLLVTNGLGREEFLADDLGLSDAQVAAYFDRLGAFAEGGGNLVLTDGALHALAELGLVGADAIADDRGLAGFYAFDTGQELTYEDPETYPLTRGVNLPGAAEETTGNRQAVEPVTLGYSPRGASHARMPFWGVDRGAWEALCEKDEPRHCTTAATSTQGSDASVGEVAHGDGVVRIVGSLLPDPNPVDVEDVADHRFGLGSYAITWTAYEVFENLVDWQREGAPVDEPVATELAYTGDTVARGSTVELAAVLTTADGGAVADRSLTFTYGDLEEEARTDEAGEASIEAPAHSGREETVEVVFDGDDDHEPSSTEATIARPGAGSGGGGGSGGTRSSGPDDGDMSAASAAGTAPAAPALALLGLLLLAGAVGRRGARRT